MTRKSSITAALCVFTLPMLSFATAAMSSSAGSTMPTAGFFAGLGGSYNSVNLNQNLYASGVSDVYEQGVGFVASGRAGGPASPFHNTQTTFAPEVQAGYFKNFANSAWLWGTKLSYQYLGTTSTNSSVDVPQYGSFTSTTSDTFTGNVIIGSAQTNVTHQLALIPFFGHSFMNSLAYVGIGPALFGTRSNIYGETGYADINGVHANITGTSSNFESSKWVWGAEAELGMNYYINPTVFVDLNYTYAITAHYTTNYSGAFSSTTINDGNTYTTTGTLYTSVSQQVTAQAVGLSINKVF